MIFWRAVQGFIGGGMIPTVFATAFTIFPRSKLRHRRADDRPGRDAGADHRPDGRRLSDRRAVLALAVLHQHRPRHRASRSRRSSLIDFDKPDCQAVRELRLGRPAVDGRLPRRARIRAGGRPAQRLVRRRQHRSAAPGSSAALGDRLLLRACSRRKQPIVDLRAFADRNFALGSLFSFVLGIGLYGLTYLYPLYLGADPRLQRADDRRDHVRLRPRDVPDRADRRPPDRQGRPALHADGRLPVLRASAPGG